MELPIEFKKLTRGFHQGAGEFVSSVDELVEIAVSFVEPGEYAALARYLATLLSQPIDGQRLQEVWQQSPADIYFTSEDDLLKVLQAIQKKLLDLQEGAD